ncbi:MAG: hypothetical protein R3C03_18210 [Pirellulaceae bacterium]
MRNAPLRLRRQWHSRVVAAGWQKERNKHSLAGAAGSYKGSLAGAAGLSRETITSTKRKRVGVRALINTVDHSLRGQECPTLQALSPAIVSVMALTC